MISIFTPRLFLNEHVWNLCQGSSIYKVKASGGLECCDDRTEVSIWREGIKTSPRVKDPSLILFEIFIKLQVTNKNYQLNPSAFSPELPGMGEPRPECDRLRLLHDDHILFRTIHVSRWTPPHLSQKLYPGKKSFGQITLKIFLFMKI